MEQEELDITHYFFSDRWIEILDEVTFFSKKSRLVWYRGQNNNHAKMDRYSLQSGLFRQEFSVEEILEWEEISYKRFFENGYEIHKTENQWNLLYIMQQYGVKTRLLDWTESFAVALYFATKEWNRKNPCSIWLLAPLGLNKIFHDLPELKSMPKTGSFLQERVKFQKSMALSPTMNTYRSMFQKGFFTLQGNTKHGLEEEGNGILLQKKYLKHIEIRPELMNDVKLFLELSGMNHFSLFPDLAGLASYVNQWTTEDLLKKNKRDTVDFDQVTLYRQTQNGKLFWKEDNGTYM